MTGSILLVGNFLSRKAKYWSVGEELAGKLRARGWRISLTSHESHRLGRILDMLGTVVRERRNYQAANVDVFSGAGFRWAELVCVTLRSLGKPFALTLRGGDLPNFAARHPGRVRSLLTSAKFVVSPSGYLAERLKDYRPDIVVLPNPLDVGRYAYRRRSEPKPRLVWLRALRALYNPAMVPVVVAELARDFPEVEAILIGPDKGDGSLQATRDRAAERGVSDRIHFIGPVPKDDVPGWLDRGDVFVNTTDIDNMPTSVMEAMVCGLCIVSTDVGGVPFLLEHEQDALLVPPRQPSAMADSVRRILTDQALAGRLSTQARRKAEQFDWSVILPRWEELLGDLIRT